jgi:hypothetical protein
MSNNKTLLLKENGFIVEIATNELTFVTNETGGLAERPLYIVIIINHDSEITYRLKEVHFYSVFLFDNACGEHRWTNAKGRADALAKKITSKDVIDMDRWQKLPAKVP